MPPTTPRSRSTALDYNTAVVVPDMLSRARESPAEEPPTDESAELIALLHSCSPTYMKARHGGKGARLSSSSSATMPSTPVPIPSLTQAGLSPAVGAPSTEAAAESVQLAAEAAEAALGAAICPAKAAIFHNDQGSAPSTLLSDPEPLLIASQLACGPEARVKLSGKRRKHVSVHALDEAALERSLVAVVLQLCERADELDLEVRWLLRGPPARRTPELLERWERALAACRERFPLRALECGLHTDQSCVRLHVHADGWEEWPAAEQRSGASRAPAAVVIAFLMTHMRYGHAATISVPLAPLQEQVLRERVATLRALGSQSGALAMLLADRGKDDGPAAEPGAKLLLCGCRAALKKAAALVAEWRKAQTHGAADRQVDDAAEWAQQ